MPIKVVVLGGTGLIGAKLVRMLFEQGVNAIAASPSTGVNALTGEGLSRVLEGANVVIDVSNAPSYVDEEVMQFFTTSTSNVLAAEASAGIDHHIALSVVGADRMVESGYMRAKVAQEELIKNSGMQYTILRATQFFEFLEEIAMNSLVNERVLLAPVSFQPISADDVVEQLAKLVLQFPLNKIIDLAGPERRTLDETIRTVFRNRLDAPPIVTDPNALYFGSRLNSQSLVPIGEHLKGTDSLEAWAARRYVIIR
jgi:uncharacterized protein YbjT (DUF2867 family)